MPLFKHFLKRNVKPPHMLCARYACVRRCQQLTATKAPEGKRLFDKNQLNLNHNLSKMAMSTTAAAPPPPPPVDVFAGQTDRFGGITVDSDASQNLSVADFELKLRGSLAYWRREHYRAIWFRVRTAQSNWLPTLTKLGFDFHHANAGYVVLNIWLPTDEPANLPVYGHTLLGVGGLVLDESTNRLLAVSDRYALIPNSWKLPGGYVEPTEDIVAAAIREVREETGIETEFRSLVALRHSHAGMFGCSDLYVVVGLRPTSRDIKRCEREIARVDWLHVDEFLQHPNVHETNRSFVRTYLDYQRRGIALTAKHDIHPLLKKPYALYAVEPAETT